MSLLATGVLGVLLLVLASLQYRWVGQVAEAERERTRASLSAAASGFAADFDREIGHVVACFEPVGLEEWTAERLLRASECVGRSGLQGVIAELYLVSRRTPGEITLSRLDKTSGRLEAARWPEDLTSVRSRFEGQKEPRGFGRRLLRAEPIDGDAPAIVLPEMRRGFGPPHEAPAEPGRFLVIRLDLSYLKNDLLPDLVRRYFGSRGLEDYQVTVVPREDPARPIYFSGSSRPASPGSGDVTVGLLTLRVFAESHRAALHGRVLLSPRGAPGFPPPEFSGGPAPHGALRSGAREGGERLFAGPWRLVVAHRQGSLDAAVARTRRRNLGIGLGTLAVLAGSVAMLVVSARRAQHLARQQIDFVAGVSHELHTPLTAIRSAGQNLADGVVAEPSQVRSYGSMIESEGRRLSELVTRILDFAGIRSGLRTYRMQPTSVEAVVDIALSQSRLTADQKGVHVERDVATGLPHVTADEEALGRAVHNLIDNAIKYGGASGSVRVRAFVALEGSRPEVAIVVEDRGPGIPPSERRQIFEPFYRGEGSASGGAAGSGLGLALVRPIVEAHGGTVSVESNDGGAGARFIIRIPTAAAVETASP